ncbi:MAG: endonuclease/exonuclease/phosphatase family protein [Alistipes sp.]|uniref:endonuclease/exonuclease/phosphatase family protein n=1 Tax=Alistipes sp. TaxID=1872444 RepID=UPI0025BE2591|nr:endonuclease/exonuclease/phosphatase family protein [Alistipes sp.]MCD8276004.1 endonuclease/exonuclease/phosphatase family protein [Alistipes sp.]
MKRLIYLLAAVAFTACGSATSFSVMTFNMRYDNPEDGENNWRFRRERVAEVIKAQDVDVLGTQELLSNQFDDLSGLLTGYQGVGVGRLDGAESGEYCAVFFKKERFTLLDSGTFWLSETPEVVGSLGWDGACERIATWVVLRDRDGRELFFIDTHLDHVGQVARDEGVSLLMKRIEILSGGRPVILTGDFNSEPESSVVAHVQKDGVLRDAKAIAAQRSGTDWSFSDFGRIPEAERPLLDYIFVSGDIEAVRYEVLPDTFDGGYVSDHAPVMAVVKIAK